MFCPECGYDAEDAKFCPDCGHGLTPTRDALRTPGSTNRERPRAARQTTGRQRTSRAGSATPAERTSARGQEQSQPAGGVSRPKLFAIIGAVGAVVASVVVVAVVLTEASGDAGSATKAVAVAGEVKIPVQDVADGSAHFFTYDAAGVPVDFFVLKTSEGKYRAALDASPECGPFKKGFRQEGVEMVCNKCLDRIAFTNVGIDAGACDPVPLRPDVSGQDLVLKVGDLDQSAQHFD